MDKLSKQKFGMMMTSMLPDEDKIDLIRHTFVSIMKKIESKGYHVTGDSEATEENLKAFFGTDSGTHCSMMMVQFLASISASPEDYDIEVGGDDCPFDRNVNVTLN
jgi:hypothetical protein